VNLEKIVFGFFIIFACTLNFGFVIGDIDRPELHHRFELFAALIATVLKLGDRTHIGATHLATSLVATFQLLWAAGYWMWFVNISGLEMTGTTMSTIVSLSAGALLANLVSVVLLIGETLRQNR